jgi:hypothetical protein
MNAPEDKLPFAEAMQMLCATHQIQPTKALLSGYFIALKELSLEEAQAVILWALGSGGKYMPKAHELREEAFRRRRKPWAGFTWDTPAERKRIAASWENAPRLLTPVVGGE